MKFKCILPIGLLFILFTSTSVFAQNNVASSTPLKSNLVAPMTLSAQIELQKNTSPKSVSKPNTNALLEQLRKSSYKSIKSGGVDTGGGTILKTSQGIGLLDLYLYNKAAFSDRRMSNNILDSRSLQNLGVDLLTNKKQPIIKKTLAQIAKWSPSSPILTQYLTLALENLRIYYHQGTFITGPQEYHLPDASIINTSDLKMIAIYIKGFGVHIGLDDFKNLPEIHQIALLIHEGLRALSIAGDFNYSNETIQKLTATLVSDPKPKDSLDDEIFLNGKVFLSLMEYADLIKKVQEIKNATCSEKNAIENIACDVQDRDFTIDGSYKAAEILFTHLYSLPKDEKTQKLLNEAYLALMRFENAALRDSLSKAHLITLPNGYLTMLLESFIDIENHEGLQKQESLIVKNALREYFQSIGVGIKYLN